jgi:hypothetical protein
MEWIKMEKLGRKINTAVACKLLEENAEKINSLDLIDYIDKLGSEESMHKNVVKCYIVAKYLFS